MTPAMQNKEVLMQVRDFSLLYKTRLGPLSAVDHVTFDLYKGEIIGLVGESGCGKSTLGKALLRMAPPQAELTGQILFRGEDILQFDDRRLRDFRGRCVSMIFQDPMTSLNPVQRVDQHLVEAIQVHEPQTPAQAALERARSLIGRLGIQERRLRDYPHQLSGGMRQRAMLAMTLLPEPELVIADEPTTALDVTIQAQIFELLLKVRGGDTAVLLITHDIYLAEACADRLWLVYHGRARQYDGDLEDYRKLVAAADRPADEGEKQVAAAAVHTEAKPKPSKSLILLVTNSVTPWCRRV